MRPNVVRGSGFRGVLNYALSAKKGAVIVGGNLDGVNPRELASEFSISRQLRPECGRPVWHVSLSAAPGEHLTDQQWNKAAEILVESVGLSSASHQFVAIRHQDTEHDHIHVIASRIGLGGELWHGQHDADAAQKASDLIERQLGLVVTRNRDSSKYRPQKTIKCSKREAEMWLRKGVEIPPKFVIAAAIDEALLKSKSWEDLTAGLSLSGIELKRNARGAGYRLNYVEPTTGEECSYKASDIGKSYSYKQVARVLEENVNGQNRPNEGESSGAGRERSAQRDTGRPRPNESTTGRNFINPQDVFQSAGSGSKPKTETDPTVQSLDGHDLGAGHHWVDRGPVQQPRNESVQLGQGSAKIPNDAPGISAMGASKSLTIEEDTKMDRESLQNQVRATISEIMDQEEERIELMDFAAALREKGIEAKLHYNEKIKKIMGFGLDCEGEHFQGHEVGIPWQSIRQRIILPEPMKKLDKPIFIISSAEDDEGGLPTPTCSRQEALEAARNRAAELFEGIQMEEEEDGWALFSNEQGEVQFYEQPDGRKLYVNQDSYEAVAASLIYGNARWGEGNVMVTSKSPRFIEKCLRAADEYGIQIANREELERIINGDIQSKPSPNPKDAPKVPFAAYAETLEKLVEFEGYASLGDNEKIKADLRGKLEDMSRKGVLVEPGELKKLAEKLADQIDQIGYPEQAEAAEKYLHGIGYEPKFEDQDRHRPGMDW
ncbi:relaxase/mobilization nuclease domain-containing protein [Desulfovibrio sp. Huiquan2017]|uniref:relaxase/mobilization nuclease domain-containing protein n=1 Tax=Desulfovibrio sp. Huiquan2017 TaxID=2816861 RepID=UPI001A9342B0|nr:relaxase/mobilization nuclease domain-containing protein [Desulfovibrio sp. Huiquan2017]